MEGKPNMVLIYPKSHAECRDSVLDGQINNYISKAALGMNFGFGVQKLMINSDEWGYPQTIAIFEYKFKVKLS